MRLNGRKLFAAIGLSSVLALTTVGVRGAAPQARGEAKKDVITGHTEPLPSMEGLALVFSNPGLIKKVNVVEGQTVKAGDLLMEQDDAIDQSELERLDIEAKSNDRHDYYVAGWDLKKTVYDHRLQANSKSPDRPPFSVFEIDEAKADSIQSELQIKVSDLDHQSDNYKRDQQKLKVDRMKLYVPASMATGVVKQIKLHEGELATPDQTKPAIIIVQNDPCHVTFSDLPSSQVAKMQKGDVLKVRYPGETEWRDATIDFIDPVADSMGTLHTVKALLPNPQQRATGVEIEVKLPEKLLADAVPAGQR